MKPKDLRFPYSWEERKPLLQDQILFVPSYYSEHTTSAQNQKRWSFFSNPHPIYVEFCSGNGEWIINQAIAYPHINWIAVEMDFSRVRKIWSKRANLSLKNLLIVCGKAEEFAAYYTSQDLFSEIFIHFPDPWPKKRQEKHRLFQRKFLLSLESSLQDGGKLHLVTDVKDYIDASVALINKFVNWHYLYESPHFVINKEQVGSSWFHRLWQEKGRDIFYMTIINKKIPMMWKKKLTRIRLDATSSNDIVWSAEQKKAEEIGQTKGQILWEFDFGCTNLRGFRLQDTLQWNTHRLAIEHFTAAIWPKYKILTAAISLFQGPFDWIHYLYWDEIQKEHFERWKRISQIPGVASCNLQITYSKDANHDLLSLYAIEQLSDYLHRLNAYLPEEVMRFASFDIEEHTPIWRIAQGLSRERFPYILTDTNHSAISSLHTEIIGRSSLAMCLPQDMQLSVNVGKIWESIYIVLQNKFIPFRVIPEIFVAEDWAGLEEIIVITDSLSEFGWRQLQGFSISGGKIIFYGKSLELPNAIHWNDWIR